MSEEILAPLAGKIVKINMSVDTNVEEDDEIFIIEAMKMETPIYAPFDGKIKSVSVKEGDEVEEDDLLAIIEPV
jgi:acetyl-CoA carboxylase biotin carboxyl carrier protein